MAVVGEIGRAEARAPSGRRASTPDPARAAEVAGPAALLGGLVVLCSFNGGGFFAGTPALVAALLVLGLVARLTLARMPWAGLHRPSAVPLVLFAALALWVLASATWGVTPRALLEFDRVLAYALTFGLFASAPSSSARLRALLWGVLGAATLVAGFALVSRLLPDVLPTRDKLAGDRLSYPLTYWNALGVLMAMGAVVGVHLASDLRVRLAGRALAAAAVPALAVTLYLSLSRGSIGVAILGLLAYLAVSRPRGAAGALLALLPTTLVALVGAYRGDKLTTFDFATAAGQRQGHRAALVLVVAMALAALLRVAAGRLDGRLGSLAPSPGARRRGRLGAAAAVLMLLAALVVAGVPGRIGHQVHGFVYSGNQVRHDNDPRARLFDPGNNGRIEEWRVAWHGFTSSPLRGTGAGTYAEQWQRRRPDTLTINNAHSLYLEILSELGLVGLALLLGGILAAGIGVARRIRGPERGLYAAVLCVGGVWAIHAGVDWDWQMPAVTLPVFALGGAALARRSEAAAALAVRPPLVLGRVPRILGALVLLLLAVLPASVGLSQRSLNASAAALRTGDCQAAATHALDSIAALSVRPQPYEILAYCDARDAPGLGVTQMQRAVTADPEGWQYRYGLALLRASAGLDPSAALAKAAELNPREALVRRVERSFAGVTDPRERRSRALNARLPSD